MKPIKLIIIGLFVLTGILSALLYQQKTNRINTQIEKRELGWNPVSIKKMIITQVGKDTIELSKKDGVWKTNKRFDGKGMASQIINYFSTMQIKIASIPSINNLKENVTLQTFDKKGESINTITIFPESKTGESMAMIDNKPPIVMITNTHNKISIWKLLEELDSNK
jgi:hypothetical protein